MCTYTVATLGWVLMNIFVVFVDRAQVPGRDYMAQPGSPGMRRRCHPTFSLMPTQAKSGINAQGAKNWCLVLAGASATDVAVLCPQGVFVFGEARCNAHRCMFLLAPSV